MAAAGRTRTRAIARDAVRADLARVAFDLFQREGFNQVTITEIALAAGVSRNTFMRYFETKEDAVLGVLAAQGEQVAEALRSRPPEETDWAALRGALDLVVEAYRTDPEGSLATARLIHETPSLMARRLEKQCGWRPLLAEVLGERSPDGQTHQLTHLVRVAAALDALDVAADMWAAADGKLDLAELLDAAFEAIATVSD